MIEMKGMEEEIIEQEQQDDNNYLEVGMHCSYIMTTCLLFPVFDPDLVGSTNESTCKC